jgi:hypothetical protein
MRPARAAAARNIKNVAAGSIYEKWVQNLRLGSPLDRGITHLDFNKLRCAARAPLSGIT